MIKLGVLGCGNMGGALLRGWVANAALSTELDLYAYDSKPNACADKADRVTMPGSEAELARRVDWLVLALKPQQLPKALARIGDELASGKVLISIAAGVGLARLKELCGGKNPVIRVMPNTLALVGQGIFGLCFDDPAVTPEQRGLTERLFAALGQTLVMPEDKFNAFTALSGGGPAYVYYFLDALIEAGVTLGFTRQESGRIALALAGGCAALAEKSGKPLTELREMVCSPGGTTIEATNHLDRTGVRGHIVDAVALACEKGKKLGQ